MILASIIALNSCNSTKQMSKNSKIVKTTQSLEQTITYKAITRGSFLQIDIKKGSASIQKARDVNPVLVKLTDEQINSLQSMLSDIDLESLTTLEPPSKAFQYDGAAIASLTIEQQGNSYQTPSFDHGNPPEEIALLVKTLLSFDTN